MMNMRMQNMKLQDKKLAQKRQTSEAEILNRFSRFSIAPHSLSLLRFDSSDDC